MTERGSEFLREVYQAPPAKIDLIAHGIPDMPFADPNYFKDEFGVVGKQVLLTFGLLSPNKGIEYALRALPEIIREFPNVVYIVVGQTHPNLLRDEGEAYRLGLERLARDLDVRRHVVFFNRFVELVELMRFIGAADIYLTPYLTETQITSGTLAYAFGAGNAVVSTPYWHATELLAGDRGRLVPFRDPQAIATAVIDLLRDEAARHAMRKQAYRLGREMVWQRCAQHYGESFGRARHDHSFIGRKASPIKTLASSWRLQAALVDTPTAKQLAELPAGEKPQTVTADAGDAAAEPSASAAAACASDAPAPPTGPASAVVALAGTDPAALELWDLGAGAAPFCRRACSPGPPPF
jgi:hypothetical protein